MKLAVFDCDGTLSDGQAGVVAAMDAAFAQVGHPAPPHGQVRRIVGLSLPQAIRQLAPELDDTTRHHIVDAYKTAFRQSREDGSLREPLFDGMADLLRRLRGHDWTLGIATGKSDRGLSSTLAVHGIGDLFATTHTADRHPSKPHPAMLHAAMDETLAAPEHSVMIGDTVFDIEMAQAAGVRAIGVAWGYHEPRELLAAGAVGVAKDMRELEAMIHG
ncbi:HAD-IA family hydrolase [Aurantiacibacter gangjinensis]|uniref:Haloacid dehalogenase n=1 Tax=Aurantiacibacter gangjinensis TaxID=502682 RepID=A0A0G9MRZ2_9SPHN|nr:HAD-IA family hydrolase [Aurantiacibacter gangjinensis]KLE33516.1 haloacid dehalogenase [Aurantiacibacter gangjinensis]